MQNKQAQQRYRERRKMKVTEMEQALAAMSQQVDELQGVLKQNVALQVPNPCTCCPHTATHLSAVIACVHAFVYCVCGHVALVRLSLLLNRFVCVCVCVCVYVASLTQVDELQHT